MNKLTRMLAACALGAAAVNASAATFVGARDDFRDETIYFAMTTRFYDGDPMNNVLSWDKQEVQKEHNDPDWRGDFAGLIQKLDYIKALGFTTVWITPVVQNCSGEDYHGYHAMDFQNVDVRYESRKEWGCAQDVKFQDLIDAAHAKGMKIVLDIVLNHTGNFGEAGLCHLFTRSQNIKDQANVSAAIIPNYDKLPSNYNQLDGNAQYAARFPYMKNNNGKNLDTHNYYHHSGTNWNWDDDTRWWAQIAGDCVDLNTENPAVAKYLVDCYGKFIEMGVDGFRIDTTGHISRLTFNTSFIPQFNELAEKYKAKRNGGPFFMFGECCQRFQGSVTYRDHAPLSSYFYQWKSPDDLVNKWDWNASTWDNFTILDGQNHIQGNMKLCIEESNRFDKASSNPTSNNHLMVNGAWHQPDYSQYSGFSTIDFPTHYGFNNASYVMDLAKGGDKYYNDASYLVTYVDSHDYCPGPNDGVRFNGGTAQWAENLSVMFTFRGIPCIYYGSEVEFKKGKPIDVGGSNNKTPRKDSGRAYFGEYLEGNVSASDFAEYTADGNVAKTLNADLAHHLRMLNKIRAAVPALRKGQYTFDGCSANGGWAFKRAYKDSYALVTVNGGGSFSSVPNGSYVDIVTGTSYNVTNGTLKVDAPKGKGQVRVVVKDWKGGKVIDDGKFIYGSSPVAHGGDVVFEDKGTTHYYTAEDAPGQPEVKLNPGSTSFKTETLTVTAALSETAKSGWYKIGDKAQVNLTPGQSTQFTVGEGMAFGESVSVTWSATDGTQTFTGKATYRKVDPNAVITVYVTASSAPNLYAWEGSTEYNGAWPGAKLTNTEVIDGKTFYYMSFPDVKESLNIIFNNGGGAQTADITGITADVYYEYDGGSNAKEIEVVRGPKAPVITANPRSGQKFNDKLIVTLAVSPATDIYYTLDGSQASASSTKYTAPITLTSTTTINTYAKNEIGETRTSFTYTKVDGPIVEEWHAYFDNSASGWSSVNAYAWDDNHKDGNAFTGAWPGKALTETVQDGGKTLYHYSYTPTEELKNPMIIFNGNGQQTGDLQWENGAIYNNGGKIGVFSGVSVIDADENAPVRYFNLQGIEVRDPQRGQPLIRVQGNRVTKVIL